LDRSFYKNRVFDIVIDALDYCRKNKGMIIFGYCIMPSHIHLIFRSAEEKPSELIRDFKGFSSRKLIKAIQENNKESRKEWLLWMMKKAGAQVQMSQIISYGNKITNLLRYSL
jgi:putative transposase